MRALYATRAADLTMTASVECSFCTWRAHITRIYATGRALKVYELVTIRRSTRTRCQQSRARAAAAAPRTDPSASRVRSAERERSPRRKSIDQYLSYTRQCRSIAQSGEGRNYDPLLPRRRNATRISRGIAETIACAHRA